MQSHDASLSVTAARVGLWDMLKYNIQKLDRKKDVSLLWAGACLCFQFPVEFTAGAQR